ncbi:MAG: hypothetical protein UFJ18_08460 [Blautia sp.]|nr:hypothetical protein [Blautia sp.]
MAAKQPPKNVKVLAILRLLYFRNIDFSKFKENAEPKFIYQMLVMLSEGYLSEKQRTNTPIIFDEATKELKKWQDILKQASYKEEYL